MAVVIKLVQPIRVPMAAADYLKSWNYFVIDFRDKIVEF